MYSCNRTLRYAVLIPGLGYAIGCNNLQGSLCHTKIPFYRHTLATKQSHAALQPRSPEFERLEFLGDRVLGLTTAIFLYKKYPKAPVDHLARTYEFLVSNESLANLYKLLSLNNSCLQSSYYHAPDSGPIAEKTAADIIEALLGALYLDYGLEQAQEFIEALFNAQYEFESSENNIQYPHTLLIKKCAYSKSLALQNRIGYFFTHTTLLKEAFLHTSAGGVFYKVLTFIGVRVLALSIAEDLYTTYPQQNQGFLTTEFIKRASNPILQKRFQQWRLGSYLTRQSHQGVFPFLNATIEVPKRIAVDTLRTLMAAIYLDGKWNSVQTVYKTLFHAHHNNESLRTLYEVSTSTSSESDFSEEEVAPWLNKWLDEEYVTDNSEEIPCTTHHREQKHPNDHLKTWPSLCTTAPQQKEKISSKKSPSYAAIAQITPTYTVPATSTKLKSLHKKAAHCNPWPSLCDITSKQHTKKSSIKQSEHVLSYATIAKTTSTQTTEKKKRAPIARNPLNKASFSEHWPSLSDIS